MREPPGPPAATRRARAPGFTILEFLVVVTLVTLTAAFSIWAYFARPEVTLDNAAQLLVRDLRVAQSRADLLHSPVSVVFRENGDGYKIVDGLENVARPRDLPERIERLYSRDAVFEGVSILPLGLAARGRILYPGDGSPPEAGRITLSYGRATRLVGIETETGRVHVSGH